MKPSQETDGDQNFDFDQARKAGKLGHLKTKGTAPKTFAIRGDSTKALDLLLEAHRPQAIDTAQRRDLLHRYAAGEPGSAEALLRAILADYGQILSIIDDAARMRAALPACWRLSDAGDLVQHVPLLPQMQIWIKGRDIGNYHDANTYPYTVTSVCDGHVWATQRPDADDEQDCFPASACYASSEAAAVDAPCPAEAKSFAFRDPLADSTRAGHAADPSPFSAALLRLHRATNDAAALFERESRPRIPMPEDPADVVNAAAALMEQACTR